MSTNKNKSIHLDKYEKELEQSFGRDHWVENTDFGAREKTINAAKLSKSERTNIRLSEGDLQGIKQRANERGLGYQTLIASLVHQYVTGRLMEVDSLGLRRIVSDTVNTIIEKAGKWPSKNKKIPRKKPSYR